MAASGISRRRRVGGGDNGDTGDPSPVSMSTDSSSASLSNPAFSSNYSSNNRLGESKIAYDPRDLPPSSTLSSSFSALGGTLPRLTLMEEILLLGLKDKSGYISFWNDNISYVLRGCILVELALRRRIAVVRDSGVSRRGGNLGERIVEVLDDRMTGETLLDETLRMMKSVQDPPATAAGSSTSSSFASFSTTTPSTPISNSTPVGEKLSVNTWIDLLSGETWNVLRISFQLKQVRERLAKGLVDKGVLRTEKRNFLLFDMATHPVADGGVKSALITRLLTILTATTTSIPPPALLPDGTQARVVRSVVLVCAAYCASVLDGCFGGVSGSGAGNIGPLGYEDREAAFARADEILQEFSVWPWGGANSGTGASSSNRKYTRIATGSSSDPSKIGREAILGLVGEARKEVRDMSSRAGQGGGGGGGNSNGDTEDSDPCFELIAGVLEVLGKLDSLL